MGGRNRPDEEGYEGASVDRHTLTDSKDNNRLIRHFGYISREQSVGRSRIGITTYSRKVRAPVDRPPGNAWARVARVTRDGKCHREETAILRDGKGETVE